MPINGTSTDYSGRTLDIYISGDLDPLSSKSQRVTYAFAGKTGITKYVAGVQKLAQRYLITLLNSGFIERLQGSPSSNISWAKKQFNTHNWNIIKTFRDEQNQNTALPTDEQLDTVQLTSMASETPDSISISLKLITRAGTNVTFVMPLPL